MAHAEASVSEEHDRWLRAVKEFTGQIKEHDPGRWERLVRMVRERDAARLLAIPSRMILG